MHIIFNNIAQCYATTSDNPPLNLHVCEGKPDTAASKHYIMEENLPIYNDVKATDGPYVTVTDGNIMFPTKKQYYHYQVSSPKILK